MDKETFYKERREKAEALSIIEVAEKYGYELKRLSNTEYKIKGMGGLTLNREKNNFFWHSQNRGGGVIQFVEMTQNLSYGEAIKSLLGSDFKVIGTIKKTKENNKEAKEKKPFELPEKIEGSYKRLYAYLLKTRKLEKSIVDGYVKAGLLYENTKHSIVFVGKNKLGDPYNATWRSTGQGSKERGCVLGSNKAVPFSKRGSSNTLFIFEAPIDLLSFQSLNYQRDPEKHSYENLKDHYISLDGVMTKGLEGYLSENQNIKNLVFCLDNDEVGREAKKKHSEYFKKEGYNVFSMNLPEGIKDWNEYLVYQELKQESLNKEDEAFELN